MAHFPNTPGTHLDFNNGAHESDKAETELSSRPDAFTAFAIRIAFLKEEFITMISYRF